MKLTESKTKSTPVLSLADAAAHEAGSHVRPFLSSAGREALRRLEADRARVLRGQYDAALVERGMAEYEEWAAGQVAA